MFISYWCGIHFICFTPCTVYNFHSLFIISFRQISLSAEIVFNIRWDNNTSRQSLSYVMAILRIKYILTFGLRKLHLLHISFVSYCKYRSRLIDVKPFSDRQFVFEWSLMLDASVCSVPSFISKKNCKTLESVMQDYSNYILLYFFLRARMKHLTFRSVSTLTVLCWPLFYVTPFCDVRCMMHAVMYVTNDGLYSFICSR